MKQYITYLILDNGSYPNWLAISLVSLISQLLCPTTIGMVVFCVSITVIFKVSISYAWEGSRMIASDGIIDTLVLSFILMCVTGVGLLFLPSMWYN